MKMGTGDSHRPKELIQKTSRAYRKEERARTRLVREPLHEMSDRNLALNMAADSDMVSLSSRRRRKSSYS